MRTSKKAGLASRYNGAGPFYTNVPVECSSLDENVGGTTGE